MQTKVEEKPVKSGWQDFGKGFVSLRWYDGFIEFLFRFVAKTSEPLLAIGLVISAADVLTKGRLMAGNPDLSYAWAWTQAIAIESSGGVVLVYALLSFRDKDRLKGWLYVALSILLAFVGGMMLYSQLMSNATGTADIFAVGASWQAVTLVILRVIVSVGYVVMCRTKHIRFNDLKDTATPAAAPVPPAPAPVIDYGTLASELESRIQPALERRIQGVYREIEFKLEQVTGEMKAINANPVAGLLAAPEEVNPLDPLLNGLEETPGTRLTPVIEPGKGLMSYEAQIEAIYRANPEVSATEAARLVRCSIPTASKWLQRLRVPGQ